MDSRDELPHHRRSLRLRGFDYSVGALYFVTLCTRNKECIFGHVHNEQMYLNELGRCVEHEWRRTCELRGDDVQLHSVIVMPNHLHAIVELHPGEGDHLVPYWMKPEIQFRDDLPIQRTSVSRSLGAIIRGFKGATSRLAGRSIWQRNYYEHIIRHNKEMEEITKYIQNNPIRWGSPKADPL